jgi:hypothetical protein
MIRNPVGALGGTPTACVSVNTRPPTVTVPLRTDAVGLGATV